MSCPVCTSNDLLQLVDAGDLPILSNELCASRETATSVGLGRIELAFCRSCGHVFNQAFDGSKVEYSPAYENSLHCSGMFQQYADDLAKELVERHDLRNKRVIEVGCGQGDFLRGLCAAGDNTGFGFDPSYQGGNQDPRVTIRPVGFAEVEGELEADLVCCRHVLEHIDRPTEFLRALAAKLKPGTAIFFEVPNVLSTLRDGGIWDIIYEHCGYFSPSSLRRAFELAGFEVREVAETFSGQFLVIDARVSNEAAAPAPVDPGLEEMASSFATTYREKVARWNDTLSESHGATDGSVVAWGAGSKGNSFLNLVGKDVRAIVDINPKKRGKFVAGTGQPIVAPEDLVGIEPATVVIMNPVYRNEIAAQLEELGLKPRLLTA
jgi:SAM-dependent methyltransferase